MPLIGAFDPAAVRADRATMLHAGRANYCVVHRSSGRPRHPRSVARDDAEAVAGFARLGLIATVNWPMVAAWLLDSGFDGASLAAMAALDTRADAWDVDPLRGESLREISAPVIDDDRAVLVVAFAAASKAAEGHPVLRRLAAIAPSLDYPGGLIGECYGAEEFLDCDCHPDGRLKPNQLEDWLRTTLTLLINPGLAHSPAQSLR